MAAIAISSVDPEVSQGGGLAAAIAAYHTALQPRAAAAQADQLAQLMEVLTARDNVARALASAPTINSEQINAITKLDEQLRGDAPAFVKPAGKGAFEQWRTTVRPAPDAWWWTLDQIAAKAKPKDDPRWVVVSGICLTISVALFATATRELLNAGTDLLATFSTVVQGGLTLLAGSTLTERGHKWLEEWLQHLGLADRLSRKWRAGLSFVLLIPALALYGSLPYFARLYNYLGYQAWLHHQPTYAVRRLEASLKLRPNDPVAHFNLGAAYEDTLDPDKARVEYNTARELDHSFGLAASRLARLYMTNSKDKNYTDALAVLETSIEQAPLAQQPPEFQYDLLRNLGWANFGLKNNAQARTNFDDALKIKPDGAGVHCLLAQLDESEQKASDALNEWETCFANQKNDLVEPIWIATARERLAAAQGSAK